VKIRPRDHARFTPDKMAKIALATTTRGQLDLYCLEPGQEQKPHTHPDQDKIYVVLEGRGRVLVGEREELVEVGEAVVAAAGTSHGLSNPGPARLLALVVVSPPPRHGS
jgi:mannose-6-phosphate isomerase-like protein (cupin superfamily)